MTNTSGDTTKASFHLTFPGAERPTIQGYRLTQPASRYPKHVAVRTAFGVSVRNRESRRNSAASPVSAHHILSGMGHTMSLTWGECRQAPTADGGRAADQGRGAVGSGRWGKIFGKSFLLAPAIVRVATFGRRDVRLFLGAMLVLLLAGCGAGGSAVEVTPVMADTNGTYRLVASQTSVTSPGGANSFSAYSSGTLRLNDPGYTRSVSDGGQQVSSGTYLLGTTVNSILNSQHGSFTLTSGNPPFLLTGSYQVAPDFTLTLSYDPYQLPGQGTVTLSETWLKESDSPSY